MTLLTEKGTFTKETSDVDGTDQSIVLTGAFQPKAVWFWHDGDTGNGSYSENWSIGYGFSDGTTNSCNVESCVDNGASSVTSLIHRTNSAICITTPTAPTTQEARAPVTTFNSNGFTLSWDVSSAIANIIHYFAIGGTDITNVKCVNTTVNTTSGGNQAYTGVGFKPDFINFLFQRSGLAADTFSGDFNYGIGAATSANARWFFGGSSLTAQAAAVAFNFKEITACGGQWASSTGAVAALADLTSMDSDGFTLNWTDAPGATADRMSYIAIKGGLWDVGNGLAPSAAGQQTVNITSPRDPAGLVIFTWGDTTTSSGATAEAENRMSIGGADNSLNEGCVSAHDTQSAPDMISTRVSLTNKIIRAHTANATAGSSTTLAEADIISMKDNGKFILDWTTTLNGMGYVWFTVSELDTNLGPQAGLRSSINTIPRLSYPSHMDALIPQIRSQRQNVRTL